MLDTITISILIYSPDDPSNSEDEVEPERTKSDDEFEAPDGEIELAPASPNSVLGEEEEAVSTPENNGNSSDSSVNSEAGELLTVHTLGPADDALPGMDSDEDYEDQDYVEGDTITVESPQGKLYL